jgi:hypothetical protein
LSGGFTASSVGNPAGTDAENAQGSLWLFDVDNQAERRSRRCCRPVRT